MPDSQEKDKSYGGHLQISLHFQFPMARYGPCQRKRGEPETVWIFPRRLLPEGKRRTTERVHNNFHHLVPRVILLMWAAPFPQQAIPTSHQGKHGAIPSPVSLLIPIKIFLQAGDGERRRLLSCWPRIGLMLNQVQNCDENLRPYILIC